MRQNRGTMKKLLPVCLLVASAGPSFAYGPGSGVFSGIHDNTDIGKTMIRYVTGEK